MQGGETEGVSFYVLQQSLSAHQSENFFFFPPYLVDPKRSKDIPESLAEFSTPNCQYAMGKEQRVKNAET